MKSEAGGIYSIYGVITGSDRQSTGKRHDDRVKQETDLGLLQAELV